MADRGFALSSSSLKFMVAVLVVLLGTFGHVAFGFGPPGVEYHYDHHGSDWGEKCATGHTQSPVDFVSSAAIDAPRLGNLKRRAHYLPIEDEVDLSHDGHTIKIAFREPNRIRLPLFKNGTANKPFSPSFALLQCHLHLRSEHNFDGKYYDFCIHCVHSRRGLNGAAPTLGVWEITFNRTTDDAHSCNPFMAKIFEKLPALLTVEKGHVVPCKAPGFSLSDLFPVDGSYYHYYPGSLTVPPCTEGLQWYVFKSVDAICQSQYDALKKFEEALNGNPEGNYRVLQPINGRTVYSWSDPKGSGSAGHHHRK